MLADCKSAPRIVAVVLVGALIGALILGYHSKRAFVYRGNDEVTEKDTNYFNEPKGVVREKVIEKIVYEENSTKSSNCNKKVSYLLKQCLFFKVGK